MNDTVLEDSLSYKRGGGLLFEESIGINLYDSIF